MTDDTESTERLEEFAALSTLANPTASPTGEEIALYHDVTGRNELHVLDVASGELTRLSNGEVPRDSGAPLLWGSDGDRVFFHSDEAGNEQYDVYAFDRDGGVETVVQSDGRNTLHDVDQDGKFLLVGSTREGQLRLYRHDLDGDGVTALTDGDSSVWWSVISPTGDRVAYAAGEASDVAVYVAAADGSWRRELSVGTTDSETRVADWSRDGERLLIADDADGRTRIGVYDLDADATTWLGDGEYEESPNAFLADGERVIGTRERDAMTVPVVYDVERGDGREFDLPEGVGLFGTIPRPPRDVANEVVLDDDRVLVTHRTPTRRPELLAYDLATDETETLIEADHGPFDREEFADAEYFTFESDGVPETRQAAVEHEPSETLEIEALLYDSGARPSPLVVKPHGGPRGRDTRGFSRYTQVLAALGFSVLEVNYRGSIGRGREFIEELYGDWGGAEQGDIATGVEHVLHTHDWLDGDRVAVFGGSYGGYSAYWQLVQYPDRYDAGVALNGLTDLADYHENTMPDFQSFLEVYLGSPEENAAFYEERSPATHVDKLDAPLLAVHAVNDRRVPISQARILREALAEAGFEEGVDGDFEYRELDEEGHSSTDQRQMLRTFRLLDDFLDRRLGTDD